MSTKLTVILAAYNGMPYLPMAVESILLQSFTDFTFIIVNDGSTDGSEEFLGSLTDPRIVLINQANEGQGAARNAALIRCQSEYTALMDADDISKPERLLYQLEYLEAHPDVVVLGTQIEFLVGAVVQRAFSTPSDHTGIQARLLKGRAGLCHPSLMFRTAAATAFGGYPSGVFGEDLDFCLRISEEGRAANLDQVLFQYRLHVSQMSLARCGELLSGNRYAAYRAVCRRNNCPAEAFSIFLLNASFISRCRWALEAWELIHYRTARIRMASGKRLSGIFSMTLSGMCRPVATMSRFAQAFGTLRRDRGC